MMHPKKFHLNLWRLALLGFLFTGLSRLSATPGLDYSSPVSFFTNTANLFLKTAGYPFTVGNIPIYPTNCYTPGVHRLLQLAANLYDCTTNRVFDDGSSPNGPFYPSVFRPNFFVDTNRSIFINGYMEETPTNAGWTSKPLSLSVPEDLARVSSSTTNIYGIPYVIGARKGFPNFNQFQLQNSFQITRALQIVKPYASAPPGTWQTNLQFTLSVSNALGIAAWNSYSNAYPRGIDFVVRAESDSTLTDGAGYFWITNQTCSSTNFLLSNQWQGIGPFATNPNRMSILLPLYTNIVLLPQSYYQNGSFIPDSGPLPFATSSNLLTPHFEVTVTNRLCFAMVDAATGRLIDYVTLDNLNQAWDLVGELQVLSEEANPVGSSPWPTNYISSTEQVPVGVVNQINASLDLMNPPPSSEYLTAALGPYGSLENAERAFENFLVSRTDSNLSMEAPLIAYCHAASSISYQVNDPLVHYTAADLPISFSLLQIPPNYTNTSLKNVNASYSPWGRGLEPPFLVNMALKDALISQSDDWDFPSGQPLNFQMLGGVHRGTPWQTVYLKSTSVDSIAWQAWTGNTNCQDAALSQPTNDWALVAALAPYLNTQSPPQLASINQTDSNGWASLFEGITVLTNTTTGLVPLVIDDQTDSNAVETIIAGINAERSSLPGQFYSNVGQLLAVPQLSVDSPFLNPGTNTAFLNDAAYESIPSQLLPLLRPDSIGSTINTNGVFQFEFTGVDGWNYSVETSTNLHDWSPIATQQQTTNGVLLISVPTTNSPQRFYRTVLGP